MILLVVVSLTEDLIPEIPGEVLNVLLHAEQLREASEAAFLGYEPLTESEVVGYYKDRTDKMSFFGAYEYLSGFRLTEDMQIELDDAVDGELDPTEMIDDMSTLSDAYAKAPM